MTEPPKEIRADDTSSDPSLALTPAQQAILRERAFLAARSCGWIASRRRGNRARQMFRSEAARLRLLEKQLLQSKAAEPSDDLQWLYDNIRLIHSDIQDLEGSAKTLGKLPQIRTQGEDSIARPIVLGRALLEAADYQLTEANFAFFLQAVEEIEPLRLSELGAMLPALKLVLLELIAHRGSEALRAFREHGAAAPSFGIGRLVRSLRFIGEIEWKETIEQLSISHRILSLDPAGIYPRMDYETRERYRRAVADIASHSDMSESEVAQLAVTFAESAIVDRSSSEAARSRVRHVGYYLVDDEGSAELLHKAGFRAGIGTRIERLFHHYPDEVYIIGIEFIALITVVALIMHVVKTQGGWGLLAGALLLLLPATQAAVELMNYLVTTVLTPTPLPKLDFSKSVDPAAATIVAIPTLLINEKQIRTLVDDMEVRYLVNRDPNIFYALLTDLPDTAEPVGEQDARVDLAISLIEGLNQKYAGEPYGGFYLFHRHRVYNPREGAWMGWERKRGKLLDLNQLLRKNYDPFPVKTGDLARLPHIQYVLTLDSDTQLPRGTAQKMIGAMAHPLNRALVDPELNIVTHGYGILQPRVGISVHSAAKSRLAAIYSGQTGFDIYSRAISDVYQDLYGEGIFTGKGIYDVDALRQVLENRFPRNALLSHDLIEGAYARAGLVSDVEVIDDYPSHYSAYNRRKHRWLRGDWQIVRWIFNKVPDESRKLVHNPISLISKWKILDNLRRSLVEPATVALLLAGWFLLPGGPRFWTLVTLALLFLPIWFRLVFTLVRSAATKDWTGMREGFKDFLTSNVSILLNIAFLAHQAIVALDAIIRTVIRSTITHTRLLEWETATEAELGIRKRTPVDIYLDWVPLLAVLIAVCLIFRPGAAPYALPFLVAWALSKAIVVWINRSPQAEDYQLMAGDIRFLREIALRSWHYFAGFSQQGNHWLIPDNVQEENGRIAERISPTNLGFLLNARQSAVEFGFLTVSEFTSLTEKTLETAGRMPRVLGHFVNWYDCLTLQPLEPQFVSSVDSGNLIASLWSLKQGCLDLLHQPLLRESLWRGLVDHYQLAGVKLPFEARAVTPHASSWVPQLLAGSHQLPVSKTGEESAEWGRELDGRIDAVRREAQNFSPWFLPEYAAVRGTDPSLFDTGKKSMTLADAPLIYDAIAQQLAAKDAQNDPLSSEPASTRLRQELAECRTRTIEMAARLKGIANQCDKYIREMRFEPLIDQRRNLLTVGYDASKHHSSKSCYDLLASEARIATFIAVAKGEAPQEAWFRLGRQHTLCEGETVLVSWTGTMFEYLMPVIWMNSQPNTLLDRGVRAAVRAQRKYGEGRGVPWGISEAAYSKTDQEGTYQYAAFGVPGLALNVARAGSLVISPYSSCLAAMLDAGSALQNLRTMAKKKWLSKYGFYESADYTNYARGRFSGRNCDLVKCWMAHHQGMSLTALCNLLHDFPFQRWFHAEPLVQASELMLQERPLRARPMRDSQPKGVLNFTRSGLKQSPAKSGA